MIFLRLRKPYLTKIFSDRSRPENALAILAGFFADFVVDPFHAKITQSALQNNLLAVRKVVTETSDSRNAST